MVYFKHFTMDFVIYPVELISKTIIVFTYYLLLGFKKNHPYMMMVMLVMKAVEMC